MNNKINPMTRAYKLADGHNMPLLGIGTYQLLHAEHCEDVIMQALKIGYTHIDTASIYNNESDIGRAIKKSNISRDKLFITTKLWNSDQGKSKTSKALKTSLSKLALDYVDLYLIHWPVKNLSLESWFEMIELQKAGLIKSLGVSNYTVKHLEELFAVSDVKPVVNQVEFSPFLYQKELLKFCNNNSIALSAYSPLTKGKRLDNPVLINIAKNHNKTAAQIVLRWIIEIGAIALPKTKTYSRLEENSSIFDFNLNSSDLVQISKLNDDYHTSWDSAYAQ